MPTLARALEDNLRVLPQILVLRCLPFSAWALLARHASRLSRIAWALALSMLGIATFLTDEASARHAGLLGLYACTYVSAGYVTCLLRRRVDAGELDGATLFVLLAFVWMVTPVWLWGRWGETAAQALGWERCLSAYSFCTQAHRTPGLSRRESLFFLLVNPVLVFSERGSARAAGTPWLPGLLRALWGVACLLAGLSLWSLVMTLARPALLPRSLEAFLGWSAYGALLFVSVYAGHAGRASIDIGCMHLLGVRIAERYRAPLAARSPADFWRRWNSYVSAWARVHLYLPLALSASRRVHGEGRRALVQAGAIVLSFVVIGALHDLDRLLRDGDASGRATLYFGAMAVVSLAGALVARLAHSGRRASQSGEGRASWVARGLGHLAVLQLIVLATRLFLT